MRSGARLKEKVRSGTEGRPVALSWPSAGATGPFETCCHFGIAERGGAGWRSFVAVGWQGRARALGDANGSAPKRRGGAYGLRPGRLPYEGPHWGGRGDHIEAIVSTATRPHDEVGISSRTPGVELAGTTSRAPGCEAGRWRAAAIKGGGHGRAR